MSGLWGGQKRKTFHGYAAATIIGPEWRVGYLVFQAGLPKTRGNSLTGGGQIYGHEYMGWQQPLLRSYAPGILSTTGGGQIPYDPAQLAALFGGRQGISS